jgi:hypothetical protein
MTTIAITGKGGTRKDIGEASGIYKGVSGIMNSLFTNSL